MARQFEANGGTAFPQQSGFSVLDYDMFRPAFEEAPHVLDRHAQTSLQSFGRNARAVRG